MSRYIYTLEILKDDEWIKTVYHYHPTAELEIACDENVIWKLTITKRT
jgi:hypothetical protein